jgi:hypothetical protein
MDYRQTQTILFSRTSRCSSGAPSFRVLMSCDILDAFVHREKMVCQMAEMGQQRRFRDCPETSAMPPTPDVSLPCSASGYCIGTRCRRSRRTHRHRPPGKTSVRGIRLDGAPGCASTARRRNGYLCRGCHSRRRDWLPMQWALTLRCTPLFKIGITLESGRD